MVARKKNHFFFFCLVFFLSLRTASQTSQPDGMERLASLCINLFFFVDLNIEIAYGHGALITSDGLSECSSYASYHAEKKYNCPRTSRCRIIASEYMYIIRRGNRNCDCCRSSRKAVHIVLTDNLEHLNLVTYTHPLLRIRSCHAVDGL